MNLTGVLDSVLGTFFERKPEEAITTASAKPPLDLESIMSLSRGSEFVRIAGLSGALAVGLGAYGAHGK